MGAAIASAIFQLVIAVVISYAFAPSSRSSSSSRAAAFEAGNLPVADEGTRIYEAFGDVNIDDWMVIGYGDYRTRNIKADEAASSSGKKK